MKEICIIGAGAAGLMTASLLSDKTGINVTVFEKMPRNGIKLSITGKGRCNVTTTTPPERMKEFINHGKKFLKGALYSFTPLDTVQFFENENVPLKEERGGRIFPVSDKAGDIVNALNNRAFKNAKLIREKVTDIKNKDGKFTVFCHSNKYEFDAVVLCTGGKSYPRTGSNGEGYVLAEKLGHTVTDIRPSLVPLNAKEKYCTDMMGLSLKNVEISVFDENNKKVYSDFGEMLFCHFGVSGPVILSASSVLDFTKHREYKLIIDLKPALDEKILDKRILRDFEEVKNRDFDNALSKLLPAKLIPTAVRLSKISPDKKVNAITKDERRNLVNVIKNFPVTLTGTRPIDEAIVTVGGVELSEINPRRMESKIVKNLYFAGEIMDVDALTGGYNLQIAFSTANAVAKAISEEE